MAGLSQVGQPGRINLGAVAADDPVADERRRYTTRLQRKAQAHVTAELGSESTEDGVDRQAVMLLHHARETTGARRATLFRPLPRGQRWHTMSVFEDGGQYHGLIAPESLVLPLLAYTQKRTILLGPDRPVELGVPSLDELGCRTYLLFPLIAGDEAVALVEVVDATPADLLEQYARNLQQALTPLADAVSRDARPGQPGWQAPDAPPAVLGPATILDLVLRPPTDPDEPFEVLPDEWALLLHLDGDRTLADAAQAAGLSPRSAATVAGRLLQRGLICQGRESRRR